MCAGGGMGIVGWLSAASVLAAVGAAAYFFTRK
jgi:hypothetical protein